MATSSSHLAHKTDEQLIGLTREGDMNAYSTLYQRYFSVAIRTARRATNKIDSEDLVAEAFINVLKSIKNGSGPHENFKSYLLRSVKNTAATLGSTGDYKPKSEFDEQTSTFLPPVKDHQDTVIEKMVTVRAFQTLPTRWQEVLWYRDVEDLPVHDVAKFVGMSPNAVTQLIIRAREGLKQAWIQAHLNSVTVTAECSWVIERVGKYSRGKLTATEKFRADAHLLGCLKCPIIVEEADHLNSRLALALVPLMLGGGAAGAGYLSSVTGGAVVTDAAVKTGSTSGWVSTHATAVTVGASTVGAAAVIVAAAIFTPTPQADTSPPMAEPKPALIANTSLPVAEPEIVPEPTVEPAPTITIDIAEQPQVTYTNETASGGAAPGTQLVVSFTDGTVTTVTADNAGTWSVEVVWDSTKPAFGYVVSRPNG